MPHFSLKHFFASRATAKKDKKAQKAAKLATKTAKTQADKTTEVANAATAQNAPAAKATKATKIAKPAKTAKPAPRIYEPKLIPNLKPAAPNPNVLTPKPAKRISRLKLMLRLRREKPAPRPTRAELINTESRLGSLLFGPIPNGHRREFFHDQSNIWIWHENWVDAGLREHEMTVRYEVRPAGVYKKISAGKYFRLEGDELENFRQATHAYLYVIKKYLYHRPVAA